jgi:hypothetical protein
VRWKAKQGDSIRRCLAWRHPSTNYWSHFYWFLKTRRDY